MGWGGAGAGHTFTNANVCTHAHRRRAATWPLPSSQLFTNVLLQLKPVAASSTAACKYYGGSRCLWWRQYVETARHTLLHRPMKFHDAAKSGQTNVLDCAHGLVPSGRWISDIVVGENVKFDQSDRLQTHACALRSENGNERLLHGSDTKLESVYSRRVIKWCIEKRSTDRLLLMLAAHAKPGTKIYPTTIQNDTISKTTTDLTNKLSWVKKMLNPRYNSLGGYNNQSPNNKSISSKKNCWVMSSFMHKSVVIGYCTLASTNINSWNTTSELHFLLIKITIWKFAIIIR